MMKMLLCTYTGHAIIIPDRERVTNEVTEKGMKDYGPTVGHTISVMTLFPAWITRLWNVSKWGLQEQWSLEGVSFLQLRNNSRPEQKVELPFITPAPPLELVGSGLTKVYSLEIGSSSQWKIMIIIHTPSSEGVWRCVEVCH